MDNLSEKKSTDELIENYFSMGFQQTEILAFLKVLHRINISHRTLKRRLSNLSLYRRKNFSKIEDVIQFLTTEMQGSSQMHGYRWFHLKCLQNNLVVTQEVVRELLWHLDSKGVESRKRKRLQRRQYFNKGPNYLWHMDSYDKLKPYGLCINGCIDGFSRNIIWLQVGSTSSDSKVIAGYYLNALKTLKGCPKTLRSDLGTENAAVERIQNSLHELFNTTISGKPAFLYGKSTHNQRIEAWWSILRKHTAQFWMNLFEGLKDDDLFDGTFLDKSLIQYCFANILQKDLNQTVLEWNTHKIRASRNSNGPSGRPCIMYEMPSYYLTKNYLIVIPSFALDALASNCVFLKFPCDEDIYRLCNIFMIENGLSHNDDPYHAVDLYITLRRMCKEAIE